MLYLSHKIQMDYTTTACLFCILARDKELFIMTVHMSRSSSWVYPDIRIKVMCDRFAKLSIATVGGVGEG